MTEWIYRIHVIVTAESRDFYSALWTVIAPNGDLTAKEKNEAKSLSEKTKGKAK